jgi:ferric-dicitrate binding protein FerR (iron transport regulator)
MGTTSDTEKARALIRKYLDGECTPQEREQVEAWYNSFAQEALPDPIRELEAIRSAKAAVTAALPSRSPRTYKLFQLQPLLRIAAMLVLVATLALAGYHYTSPGTAPSPQEVIAQSGERKTITLRDGSTIYLHPGSKLTIAADFGKATRQVSLIGEAFFSVAKDSRRPFIVNTPTLTSRVLGTAFNIQAYENDKLTIVAVTEGKVQVEEGNNRSEETGFAALVLPGKQLVYDLAEQNYRIGKADVERISAWKNGEYYIENESIDAIARRLERIYNLTIEVTGADKPECRYTFHFSDEPIHKVLEILSHVSGISYTTQQKHILINTEACNILETPGK